MQEASTEAEFSRLVKIMDELREQCPWDQKQTIHTLRSMTIEEVYELGDAIVNENWAEIKEKSPIKNLVKTYPSRLPQ